MSSGSGFDALVGQLIGDARELPLPDIPDVLAERVLCALIVCDESFGGREQVKRILALPPNVRRLAIAVPGALNPLDGSVLTVQMPGIKYAQRFALLELEHALAALRDFMAPGGPDKYVAQRVAEAARSLQVKKGRHRPGKPPTPAGQKALVDAAVAADIRELNYLNSPNKPDLRGRICRQHGIGRDRFYAILAAHAGTTGE